MMDQGQLDFLTQQKIELLLTMKTKKFEEELASLKTQVGSLETTIAQLRSELRSSPKPTPPPSPPEPEPTPPPEPAPEPTHNKKEQTSSHPRQGNYKSEDVSIEKYFNFSRK